VIIKWLVLVAVIVVLIGALYWWAAVQTYHFAVVHDGVLYRDGNRGIREFAHAIRKAKIKTVVALVDDGELASDRKPEFAAEMEWCKRQGVRVERIPIPLGGWPTSEDVRRFCQIVADAQNRPVLVHCAQGVRRTGMMVAAYQQNVLGWDDEKCRGQILTFGHSQRTVGDVQKFIDVYDPKTGTVPSDLPPGTE
jgi:protein tyrosine/serine phosphatase